MSGQIVLLVDAGNSAIKHCLAYCPAQTSPGVSDPTWQMGPNHRMLNAEADAASLVRLWREEIAKSSTGSSSTIGMSWNSVGPTAIQQTVAAAYQALTGTAPPPPWISKARVTLSGTHRSYDSAYHAPAQLGADRWISGAGLTALGVMAAGEAHLVVSAGTATTFDLLFQQDLTRTVFQGGWILPGIRLMHESLRVGTRQLDYSLPQALTNAQQVPRDSQSAIEQGLGFAQTALLAQLIERYKISAIWLHGGDAQRWLAYAKAFAGATRMPPITERQDLTFLGLLALWGRGSHGPQDP
ncbi:MAG: type III pantothenate kinase [Betaproteobacteria bacterium]|jgi:pantothenate kinase type III|nr:type III pantothenate kinase [Betaproteobacteria bacterium]